MGWFNDCISNVNSRLNRRCGRDSVLNCNAGFGEWRDLEFRIYSLVMFLDKEIFKKGYSIIFFGVDGSMVDGLHIQFQIK